MVIPTIAHFVLASIFVFTLTMANLLFTSACGVSAFNIRSGHALARAVVTRLCIGVIIVVVNRIFFTSTTDSVFQNMVSMVLATLFDNGVFLGTETVSYHTNKFAYTDTSMFWLPVLLISLLMYALLTFLLLRFAQWQAVRQNALPPLPSTRKNPAKMA